MRISLSFAILVACFVTTLSFAGDNATPSSNAVPAKVTDSGGPTDNDPNIPLKPGVYWYAYTMEFSPGLEPPAVTAKRKQHLAAGGRALGALSRSSGQRRLAGTKVNGNSSNPKEREKFGLICPANNPRISRAQYAKWFSAMAGEGGVLVGRVEIDENEACWALDEDPILLSDSESTALGEKPEDEQKRVYNLLAAAPARRVPDQARPTVVASTNGNQK